MVEIADAEVELTDDEIYAPMGRSGMSGHMAECVFKFTQIAFGRAFLDGLGISFADHYLCFDASGNVIESGLLAEQPYFGAAHAIASERTPAGLLRLALASPEMLSVNECLRSGGKLQSLVLPPPAVFIGKPTPAGMARAQVHLAGKAFQSR